MPKMFEIWKEQNGETKGRDCKTGREFPISENVFGYVERYSKEPKVGDAVYIHNAQGIYPYEVCYVLTAARDLPDSKDDILLYYAYGLRPTPAHVETDNMRLVVNKDCLTIYPPESDSKRD